TSEELNGVLGVVTEFAVSQSLEFVQSVPHLALGIARCAHSDTRIAWRVSVLMPIQAKPSNSPPLTDILIHCHCSPSATATLTWLKHGVPGATSLCMVRWAFPPKRLKPDTGSRSIAPFSDPTRPLRTG